MASFIEVCEEAVRAGGAELLRWVGKIQVREKGPADLVTQADLASQEVVRQIVLKAFPDHDFLGEETSGPTASATPGRYRWVVDPLDGTTNFVHGLPHYAVSLALERDGEVLAGGVFNPIRGECFTATLGGGARLDGKPIRTSKTTTLQQSLAAAGFAPGVTRDAPDYRVFDEAIFHCQSIRRTGSASLNLCDLARGRFDVYWSYSTKIWDIAAGVLMVREAGGAIVAPDGGPLVLSTGQFLAAANEPLLAELRALTASVGC